MEEWVHHGKTGTIPCNVAGSVRSWVRKAFDQIVHHTEIDFFQTESITLIHLASSISSDTVQEVVEEIVCRGKTGTVPTLLEEHEVELGKSSTKLCFVL